jgi:hypothetical protein
MEINVVVTSKRGNLFGSLRSCTSLESRTEANKYDYFTTTESTTLNDEHTIVNREQTF